MIIYYFGDSLLTGKNIAEDLVEGKVTLPLIHILRVSDDKERDVIVEKIHNPKSDNLSEINTILKKNESDTSSLDFPAMKERFEKEFLIKALTKFSGKSF